MFDIAYAMGQGGAGAEGAGGAGGLLFPMLIMFGIFYFLLIRPQQKKQKEHQEMINNLKKGDRVVTGGGIHGRITNSDENTLTVEIADNVRVKMNRGSVAALVQASGELKKKDDKSGSDKKKS